MSTSARGGHTAPSLLKHYARRVRTDSLLITLCGVLTSLVTVGFAWLVAWLINQAVYLQTPEWLDSYYWLGLAAVLIARALLPVIQSYLAQKASLKIREKARSDLFNSCKSSGVDILNHYSGAELSNLLGSEVDKLKSYFADFLPQKRLAVLMPLVVLLACSSINWLVPLILLLTAPLVPLFMMLVGHKAAQASQTNLTELNRLGNLLADRIRAVPTLRLVNALEQETGQLYKQSERFRQSTMQVLRLAFLSGTVLEFFSAISVALVAVYLGLLFLGKYQLGGWSPELTLFDGIFLLMLAPEFYLPLRRLGVFYHAKADALAAAEQIASLLNLSSTSPDHHQSAAKQHPISLTNTTLILDKLQAGHQKSNCSYPITLELQPGESLLLEGPSGVGKTTLLDTLAGLLPPCAGEIRLNRTPIDTCANEHWFAQVGYMTQQPQLLYDTLRNNLCLGRSFSDAELYAALEQAQVATVVQDLPQQLDYCISEEGGYLSGGQAQRIALARVFLHQPSLLLLDEPIASLDDETASAFMQTLARYQKSGGRFIMTSHRAHHPDCFTTIIKLEKPL